MICESDAEAKWCPFSRVLSTEGVHNGCRKILVKIAMRFGR